MDREEAGLLHGWKEIEKYLGLDRKTVVRQGYPVRRARTGSVYALREELLRHAGGSRKIKN